MVYLGRRPYGWTLDGLPDSASPFTISAGGTIRCAVGITTPNYLRHGASLELRIAIADARTGKVIDQRESFLVVDTVAPLIHNYRAVLLQDRTVAIRFAVGDHHSEVDSRRIVTAYSVDSGRTWAEVTHRADGEDPWHPSTYYTGTVGPLRAAAEVWLRARAMDVAGNVQSAIQPDVGVFAAPQKAEGLASVPGLRWLLFQHEEVIRLAEAVGLLEADGGSVQAASSTARRRDDLRTLLTAFEALEVDAAGFQDYAPRRIVWGESGSAGAATTIVIRLPQ